MATSEHVAGFPSTVHPQPPTFEHHACWLWAIDL